jgi:hypothetical protein
MVAVQIGEDSSQVVKAKSKLPSELMKKMMKLF